MRFPPELVTLAEGQNGLLTAAQVRAGGVSWKQQRWYLTHGVLTGVRTGVVKIGPEPGRAWQVAAAAVLAASSGHAGAAPGAALSHGSAVRAHRIPLAWPDDVVELTVPRPWHPRLADVRVHRSGQWTDADVTVVHDVAVTTPARTILDVASRIPPGYLAKLLDEGCVSGLWSWPELSGTAGRITGRAAIDTLRRLVTERLGGAGDVGLESRTVKALDAFRPFLVHHVITVGGSTYELDIAWPEYRVAAECDGWGVRSRSRTKFDHDRRKSNELVAAGWTIVHLTSAMTDDEIRRAVHRALLTAAARLA